MKILTGNDLKTGEVIWWTGSGWSLHVDDAVDAGDRRRGASLARENAAQRVNGAYVIDAARDRRRRAPRAYQGPHPRARPDRAPRPVTSKPADPRRRQLGDLTMYHYDDYDQAMVDARVAEFRDQVARRLAGQADRGPVQAAAADERALPAAPRLHAARRGALRHAVARADAHARRTSRASTTAATAISPRARTSSTTGSSWRTRPTSWPISRRSRCMPSRPAATASATSSSDQFAGAAADEVADPRPYAELLRQWSTLPPRVHLPAAQVQDRGDRGATTDRAAMRLHDIGIQLVRNDAGELGCAVLRRRRHGPHADDRAADPRLRAARRSC